MKPGKVRPIAICVFRHNQRILVAEGYDTVKQQINYRPLGGKIEFGELGAQTVVREIKEELGLTAANVRYLGTLESVFVHNGQAGHEIVLIYDGEFIDPSVYEQTVLTGCEDEDTPIKALWKGLAEFQPGPAATPGLSPSTQPPLYPDGLFELLQKMP